MVSINSKTCLHFKDGSVPSVDEESPIFLLQNLNGTDYCPISDIHRVE